MTDTEALRRHETAERPRTVTKHPMLGVGLIVLGLGAAVVALLGPLVADLIRYHASEGAINQVMGGDVAGLVLVAPVSIVAGILALRGHRAGPVLALGPAAYALYMYAQLALGGDFRRYPGNSELFFPLYLTLFVLSGAVAIRAWTTTDADGLPATSRRVDRVLVSFFLAVAAFLTFGLHLPGLLAVWQNQLSSEYLADPAVFWLVKFMDLGMVVPALVATAVGILRVSSWAHKAKYGAVGWAALLGSSVAGMAIVMQVTADPAATTANTIVFGVFAALAIAIAVMVYAPLIRTPSGADQHP